MKKHVRIFAAILCSAILVCGCQNHDDKTSGTDIHIPELNIEQMKLDMLNPSAYNSVSNLKLEPGSTIAFIGVNDDNRYWDSVQAGAQAAIDDINNAMSYSEDDKITMTYIAPKDKDDVDELVSLLDEELDRYPIATVIALVDSAACFVQFDLAAENGIPIVTIDSGGDYANVDAHVSTNHILVAQEASTKFANAMNKQGEIAIFSKNTLLKANREQEAALIETIQAKYPDMTVSSVYHLDETEVFAEKIANEMNAALPESETPYSASDFTQEDVIKYILETNPNIKGIYTTDQTATNALTDTLSSLSRDDFYFIAFDGNVKHLPLLTDGIIDELLVQNPYAIGYASVVAAARSVLKLGNEALVNSGHIWVTKENMEDPAIVGCIH